MTALDSAVLFRPVVRHLLIINPALKLRVRDADELAEQGGKVFVSFAHAVIIRRGENGVNMATQKRPGLVPMGAMLGMGNKGKGKPTRKGSKATSTEIRLNDLEARVKELERFMKLAGKERNAQ